MYLKSYVLCDVLDSFYRVMPNIYPSNVNTVLDSLNINDHEIVTLNFIPEIVVIVVHTVRQHFHVGM